MAISLFTVIILTTLFITYWAAQRTRSRRDFYVAGGSITGRQNGLAIAGDFISASTILGIPAMVLVGNAEAIIYIISTIVGLALALLLVVEPLRKLGQFTVSEVISARYPGRSLRTLTALISLIISLFYLLAQLVAAGSLIQLLFSIDYLYAVATVALLMMIYVIFGGMVVTTWVQIIKACMMIVGVVVLAIAVLHHAHFNFVELYNAARSNLATSVSKTGSKTTIGSLFSVFSIGIALAFGIPGLPHLLVRVLTVPDQQQARNSMLVAIYINCFIAAIVLLVFGYGALAFLISNQPGQLADPAQLVGGPNMAVVHLARIVGGDVLFGSIAAVLFATILAVVSGLTVVCSGSIAHDIYAQALMRGKVSEAAELRVFRLGSLAITVLAVLLAIAFRHKNVTFLVGLAFAVASSANFPVLLLSMYWRGLTKSGAIASCVTGLVTSVSLIVASPTVWVELLHHSRPLFPSAYPAMISVPLAFVAAYVVSVIEHLGRRNSFQERPLSSV